MAGRIRSIKPEMLEDERIAELSDGAFRLFIGMLLLADDAGRLRADVRYLTGQVFWGAPDASTHTRPQVAAARAELVAANIIVVYAVRGQEYALIRTFQKHQRIDKPSKPKCPGPDEADAPMPPEASPRPRRALPEPSEVGATQEPPEGAEQAQKPCVPATFVEGSTNPPGALPEPSARALGGIGGDRRGSEKNYSPPNPLPFGRGSPEDSFGGLGDGPQTPRLGTVEHALNPAPDEFRMALGGACGYGLTATREEDLELQAHLRSLYGQGFGPSDVGVAGAFLAAGGLRGKSRALRVDTGWLVRSRGGNLRWLFEGARAWDRAGRPALDERGAPVAATPSTPPSKRPPSPYYTGAGAATRAKINAVLAARAAAAEAAGAPPAVPSPVTVIPVPTTRGVGHG